MGCVEHKIVSRNPWRGNLVRKVSVKVICLADLFCLDNLHLSPEDAVFFLLEGRFGLLQSWLQLVLLNLENRFETGLTEQTFDSYVKVATSIVCALDSHHYQRSCLNLDHTRTFCKNEKALIFFCAINNNSCHNVTTVLQFTTPNSMQCHWPLLKMNKPCTWSLLLCLSSSWIDLPPSPSWSRRSLISSPRFLFSLLTLSNCSTVSSQAVSRRNIGHHQYDDSLIITFDVKPGAFIEMIN